ncbi:sensor histidine kinase [Nocardia sp. NBC_00416]|uniref:sensor histidine kinase n=1 Tax=Nocardia sp. NBC_00416 TaxID=2975991 RepID=UPI003FA5D7F3
MGVVNTLISHVGSPGCGGLDSPESCVSRIHSACRPSHGATASPPGEVYERKSPGSDTAHRTTGSEPRYSDDSGRRIAELVADAAHELRTPIAGIRAIVEAILVSPSSPGGAQLNHLHQLVLKDTRRAAQLIEDLLDMARLDSGQFELRWTGFELLPLVEELVDRSRLLNPNIEFRIVSDTPCTVVGDPTRIAQILTNLIDNASRVSPTDDNIILDIRRESDRLSIAVTDKGPGVPVEDRDRIFDRGVQLTGEASRSPGTSGLGLTIARRIARAHGGDLICTVPASGVGAEFLLSLPLGRT